MTATVDLRPEHAGPPVQHLSGALPDVVAQRRPSHVPNAVLCLIVLAAYILLRALLGALLNPAYNGPDESAHVEYVRSLADRGGLKGTGVESKQPPTYYLIASMIWRVTDGQPVTVQLFATRLLSVAAGTATLVVAWLTARSVWPNRPLLALAAAAITLAPGHLYLLASVNNEPMAVLFASIAVLATVRLWRISDASAQGVSFSDRGSWHWWPIWVGASATAVGTKLSALPVVLATFAILAISVRHYFPPVWRRHWRLLSVLTVTVGGLPLLAGYVILLRQYPSSSYLAALAHVGPQAILRGPLAYVSNGGLTESFRTFWHAYDYSVRWPIAADVVLGVAASALTLLALGGLIATLVTRGSKTDSPTQPGVLWVLVTIAAVQVMAVIFRFGLSELLGNHMGGAAQAKAFFAAIVPLAVACVAGVSSAGRTLGWPDRHIAAATFGLIFMMDVASMAITLWQHYRWLQVGV